MKFISFILFFILTISYGFSQEATSSKKVQNNKITEVEKTTQKDINKLENNNKEAAVSNRKRPSPKPTEVPLDTTANNTNREKGFSSKRVPE